jgi:hypothetical protein
MHHDKQSNRVLFMYLEHMTRSVIVVLCYCHIIVICIMKYCLIPRFAGAWSDGRTLFVNATTCNYHYKPTNQPIVIHLPFDKSLPATVVT